VLPPYRRLVIDEAHHLEDVATTHLGAHVSGLGVQRLLNRLERNGRGLLPTIAAAAPETDPDRSHLFDALAAARRAADTVFALLGARLATAAPATVLRLTPAFAEDPVWSQGLAPALENLLVSFDTLRDGAGRIAESLQGASPGDRELQLIAELWGVVRRLTAAAQGLTAALRPAPGGAPVVRWIEQRGKKGTNLSLAAVPLELAPLLKEQLFDRVETVVLTSATLAAGGEFTFLEERLGLDLPPERVAVREVLPSPFDFASQCLFGVPTDFPEPRDDASGHDAAVARALLDLARVSDGGMFVLFTSHGALRRTAAAVRGEVSARWPLLVQGEGQRDHLLRRFRESGSAILLGTDSFWEGVDVPGRALRLLILAKLPFKVPTEPLTAARLERLEERGVNGFTRYLVPLAALKLKQGFGRLIRTRADAGVVLLLDRRAVTKPYGARILDGLPPAESVVAPWDELRRRCELFFAERGIGAPVP